MCVSATQDTLEHAVRQVSILTISNLSMHCLTLKLYIIAVCAQKGSQTCDKAVVTSVCQTQRSTGMTVPQGCPVDVNEIKKITD